MTTQVSRPSKTSAEPSGMSQSSPSSQSPPAPVHATAPEFARDFTRIPNVRQEPVSVARQTQQEVTRDNHLRDLARRPSLALGEWRNLPEGDRTVMVTYMAMRYSLEFATYFLETTRRKTRPELAVHVTNIVTAPQTLIDRGYRFAGTQGNSSLQIWVHPGGNEIWIIPSAPSTGTQQQTPSQESSEPETAPAHITLPSNPVNVYGAVAATNPDGEVFGVRGRIVRYADGTIEMYQASTGKRFTARPVPNDGHAFYDENGERVTILFGMDVTSVFGGM